jgi:hypothetical protein
VLELPHFYTGAMDKETFRPEHAKESSQLSNNGGKKLKEVPHYRSDAAIEDLELAYSVMEVLGQFVNCLTIEVLLV